MPTEPTVTIRARAGTFDIAGWGATWDEAMANLQDQFQQHADATIKQVQPLLDWMRRSGLVDGTAAGEGPLEGVDLDASTVNACTADDMAAVDEPEEPTIVRGDWVRVWPGEWHVGDPMLGKVQHVPGEGYNEAVQYQVLVPGVGDIWCWANAIERCGELDKIDVGRPDQGPGRIPDGQGEGYRYELRIGGYDGPIIGYIDRHSNGEATLQYGTFQQGTCVAWTGPLSMGILPDVNPRRS